MPNKLTDNEIKKALEICSTYKGKCTDCPAFVKVDRSNCKKVLLGAINLINRQEEEKQSLKAEVERLEKLLEQCEDNGEYWESKYKTAKAEAYKECIEKVKAENYDRCIDVIYDGSGEVKRVEIRQPLLNKQLDNLLNELEGDKNAGEN